MTDQLFDPGEPEEVTNLSRDQRRTLRNRALLAQGIHPATGAPLAGNGETCKTCDHMEEWRYAKTYFKCSFSATNSAATDIRVRWPACTLWTPKITRLSGRLRLS